VKIRGEIPIRIHHYLLGNGRRSEIVEVQSKPQAISQCRGWLAKNLPNAKVTAASSTTAAAQNAVSQKGVAAIASRQAGVNYGLNVLAAEIEDNKENTTRFAVIGREIAARTGNDKTSLMFELQHEPGALADAMTIFKRNRLNLTWIESIPKKGSQNEYIFFVELEGHQTDLRVRRALESLEKKVRVSRVLGSYPRHV
jgi:chorismate mutase/prephenate dehydratase